MGIFLYGFINMDKQVIEEEKNEVEKVWDKNTKSIIPDCKKTTAIRRIKLYNCEPPPETPRTITTLSY